MYRTFNPTRQAKNQESGNNPTAENYALAVMHKAVRGWFGF